MPNVPAILPDGTYRLYNISLTQDRWVYTQAGRFGIASGAVALLDDPTGLLGEHLPSGPMTQRKSRFLVSLLSGSHRAVIREQAGVGYLPTYSVRA